MFEGDAPLSKSSTGDLSEIERLLDELYEVTAKYSESFKDLVNLQETALSEQTRVLRKVLENQQILADNQSKLLGLMKNKNAS